MDDLIVRQALEKFYGAEAIDDEAFVKKVNHFKIGILSLPFPNFGRRRRLIYLHDINHLLTGYDTTKIGEGEVAAYELASGFPSHCWIGYVYAPLALLPVYFYVRLEFIELFYGASALEMLAIRFCQKMTF